MSTDPRHAAAVIVTTGLESARKVLLVQRSPTLRFFGGYWAFPGGASESIDRATGELSLLSCALRELLEETGLIADALQMTPHAARTLLSSLTDNPENLALWCGSLRIIERSGQFRHVCQITTPAHSPIRFATDFVELHIAVPSKIELEPAELIDSRFISPGEALAQWRRGELPIAPPTLLLLELLDEHGSPGFVAPAAQIAASFEQGSFHPARFSPGIFTAPVPTPTLPPATTTNCYIVGTDDLYVVDPAAVDHEHQQKLIRKLESQIACGATMRGILLTHHHRDHTGAVAVLSRHFRAPVHAHALTYAQLPDQDFLVGGALADGDTIALGNAPDGSSNWQLEVLHTPGHARDHLCYIDTRYRAAIVGDMLSTVSTIIIDPPEGHMATYLKSLERLLATPITMLYPAHGPAHRDGHALIGHYLAHRRQREEKIFSALGETPRSLEELLPEAYGDVAGPLRGAAVRSLLAGLEKLVEDKIAVATPLGWTRAA